MACPEDELTEAQVSIIAGEAEDRLVRLHLCSNQDRASLPHTHTTQLTANPGYIGSMPNG